MPPASRQASGQRTKPATWWARTELPAVTMMVANEVPTAICATTAPSNPIAWNR